MIRKLAILCLALSSSAAVLAAPASLDLSRYSLTNTYQLGSKASEASAITWNWDNGNLFVVGDEGENIVEINRSGQQVSSMKLTGFEDTEALTYVGNGQFVIGEERLQDVYRLNYTANGSVSRNSLQHFSFGSTIGNEGIEGISYDPSTGKFIAVKEKSPEAVYEASINFNSNSGSSSSLFSPNGLHVNDLSDVQALSTVFANQPFGQNLLIYSQESGKLMEVTRGGQLVSQLDFSAFSDTAEGVTIDSNGVIYITDESPNVYVLTPVGPVPEPGTLALMLAGFGAVGFAAKRRKAA